MSSAKSVATRSVAPPGAFPLSPLQEGMLYHAVAGGLSGEDVEQILCTLSEPLDSSALRAAWLSVIERHESLRTRFLWQGVERPVQLAESAYPLDIRHEDWSGSVAAARSDRIGALMHADRCEPFDLSRLPLMRVTVIRMASNEWQMLWTFHHILLDGRSFPLILTDLFDTYDAFRDGLAPELTPLPQHRDFIAWLGQRSPSESEDFWRRTLAGFRSPTPLPLAGLAPRPPVEEVQATELRIPPERTSLLKRFVEAQGVTLNTLVQGAWALLLHHYTGESDVVFGATRACRRSVDPSIAEATGLLINTLPVRAQVRADDDVGSFLRRLRDLHVATRAHEHTPLAQVRRWSDVAAGHPLFETLVVFEGHELDARLRARGGRWAARRFQYVGQTNFPLALVAYGGDGMLLRLEYRASLLDSALARQLARHLGDLIEGLAESGATHPAAVPYGSADDHTATAAVRSFSVDEPIHVLFERQASQRPDAPAAVYEDLRLSYRELDERSERLARHLRSLGVRRDVLVGLLVDRSLDMVVAILGVLKAGGAYVPIDPAYPAERIRYILEDAGVKILVAQSELLHSLPTSAPNVVPVDDPTAWGASATPSDWIPADPSSLAYVIYTSGSTGKPKGVLVTHANVVRLLRSTEGWFDFGPGDVWTLFHSYAFDFSVWELWGALAYGGRLVVVPYVVSRSPESFLDLVDREKVTVLSQTPSAFLQLSAVATGGVRRSLALRWVVFGGEALDPRSLRPWLERFGCTCPRLVNMYGITETTVHVTFRLLGEADIRAGTRSVIGEPLPDLKLLVLDPFGRPAPVGVAGELHVGGAGLSRGYLNRPELTAERFIADPYEPGGRLYRTGDLARRLPGGDLEYLGRRDDQVKVRGFRIELGEVEGTLAELPEVAHAAVVVRQDEPGHLRLVGYWVPRAGVPDAGSARHVRAELAKRLPEHMIPAALVPLEALPLTPHGKVDRRALPAPEVEPPDRRGHVPPRNDAERILVDVWREVLGVPQVGIEDDFFDLGGDSILSIQIVSRARARGLELRAGDLLLNPTIAELSAVAAAAAPAPRGGERARGPVSLTPIQSWFFDLSVPNVHHWNQWLELPLAPNVDPDALEQALRDVTSHHDALRLRFTRGSSGWTQAYADEAAPLVLERVDGAGTDVGMLLGDVQRGLDVTEGPLMRAVWLTGSRSRLVLVAHHLVIDGVSWRILLEDLDAAYAARRAGQVARLTRAGSSFGDWSRALAAHRRDPGLRAQRDYWMASSEGTPAHLAADFAGPNSESTEQVVRSRLDAATTKALLTDIHRAYGTRVNDVLLSAFAVALRSATGSSEVGFDLEGHGREPIAAELDVSRTVGWFTSIFPVRLRLPEGDLGETLTAVKQQLRSIPQNGLGYGLLLQTGDLARGSGPNVAFNYLGQADRLVPDTTLFSSTGASLGVSHDPAATRPYDLEVIAEVIDGGLSIRWIYSERVHAAATIEAMAATFTRTLAALVEHCGRGSRRARTLSDFPAARVTQSELDGIVAAYPDVVGVCRLAPMQELYFGASLADPSLGYEQWHFTIEGPLDRARLRRAWSHAVNRRDVLRSAYVAKGLAQPHRVVVGSVDLPWVEADLSGGAEASAELERLLREDEARTLDLGRAPLSRVTVARRGDGIHELIWGTHHLAIDGWSWPLVLADVASAYRDPPAAAEESAPPGFDDFVQWLAEADGPAERAFWAGALTGFNRPHRLRSPGSPSGHRSACNATLDLTGEETAAIVEAARAGRVTLGTYIQGAWAMLLSGWTGSDDVVFGAAFSGRPAELPGAERIVGPFVNNLPVRARFGESDRVGEWLARFQRHQVELGRFQHTSLRRVHEWSEVPTRDRLFESLVVVQNYTVDRAAFELGPQTQMRCVRAPQSTNYPLTIVATPRQVLRLEVMSRNSGWSEPFLSQLGTALRDSLVGMAADRDAPCARFRTAAGLARLDEGRREAKPSASAEAQGRASALERLIASAIREVLGGAEVGIYDNFFDLGAHSLALLSLHERLEKELGRNFPVTDVFEFATVAALAEHLGSAAESRSREPIRADARARSMRERLHRTKRVARKDRGND